jgi:hypothetical protein
MDARLTRASRVAGMLLAGAYLYVDFPGADPQAVDVTYVEGFPVCRFRDAEPGDEGLELDPRDMAGEFLRAA